MISARADAGVPFAHRRDRLADEDCAHSCALSLRFLEVPHDRLQSGRVCDVRDAGDWGDDLLYHWGEGGVDELRRPGVLPDRGAAGAVG